MSKRATKSVPIHRPKQPGSKNLTVQHQLINECYCGGVDVGHICQIWCRVVE